MRCCVTPPGWLTPDCPGPWIPPLRFASVGREAKRLRRSTPDPPVSVLGLRKGQWQACRVIRTGRLTVIMGVLKKRKGNGKTRKVSFTNLIHVFTPGFSIELVQRESLLALAGD